MSAFHEELLPLQLAFGASGGPERRTEIVTLGSGREVRNSPWSASRRRYELAGAVRTLDDLHALIAFFEARQGRLHGFRFRDFADWRSGPPQRPPTPLDQPCEALAANTAQLVKRYGAITRVIRKPVAGTVRVAVGGVELAPAGFTVDPTTGIVTLAAPEVGAVTAGFAFDTPVRFDADRLETTLDGFGAGHVASVPLVEIAG